ncbi:MAG TPA: hypothetical protein VF787_18135 [Thermoanaerobaculia bacterium]
MLEQNSFAVDLVSDVNDIRTRDLTKYATLVVDVHREGRRGLDLIEWLMIEHAYFMPRVVIITGDDPNAIRGALETIGVCEVVIKPVNATEILRAVIECLEKSPEFAVQ